MTAASSFTFTLIFLAATAISLAFSVWLSLRHMRHVATHRHAVPAEFADIISLEAHQKAADYTLDKQRFGLAEEALNVVVLLGLTLGGGLAWLYLSTNGLFGNVYADGLAFVAAVGIVTGLIGLPFDVYRTFVIEAKHGFNKTTLRTYITDAVKGWALAVVIGGPLLFATLWLMEKMGGLWWLYVWLVWTGFSLLMIAVYPTYIAPLFNKFLPLEDTSLKTRIEALLAKCG
ncbi:MAG: M48 family metallopeptidase, partial [Burkholderiales bacterium]